MELARSDDAKDRSCLARFAPKGAAGLFVLLARSSEAADVGRLFQRAPDSASRKMDLDCELGASFDAMLLRSSARCRMDRTSDAASAGIDSERGRAMSGSRRGRNSAKQHLATRDVSTICDRIASALATSSPEMSGESRVRK
mmetsp:Transcript_8233/g.21701  ORF Transcript_8233/g.21701 Transcript_8233/m.21701 type:complete len:142 (-) Transcript_8233:81-506(-)